LLYLD